MITRVRMPNAPLSRAVEFLWLQERPPVPEAPEQVLPDGRMQLVVSRHNGGFRAYGERPLRFSGAVVTGARDRPVVIEAADVSTTVGAVLRAGGAFALGLPAAELAGGTTDLELVWGRDARELHERIRAASVDSALDLLESLLLRRLGAGRPSDDAVARAARALERPHRIAEVAAMTGLGPRRLGQLFRERIGLSPKRYARLRRFQRLLAALGREVDWADAAALHGYCDQAHLVREFRELAGVTPGGYLRRRKAERNHLRPSDSSNTPPRAIA